MIIPVIFPTDNNYVPVCAAFLASLAAHTSPEHEYRLIGIVERVSQAQQESLARVLKPYPWCSISFKDMSAVHIPFLENRIDFPRASYFNLDIPSLFPEYDKVVYMDSDTIVRADLAEIFALDVSEVYAAACPDSGAFALLHAPWSDNRAYPGKDFWEYWIEYMGLPELAAKNYFNNGIMVWNLKKTRSDGLVGYMKDLLFSRPFYMADQDIMNIAFAGKTHALHQRWNFLPFAQSTEDFLNWERHDEYSAARKNPAVIHYAGPKPWNSPDVACAEEFWSYSRKTSYYWAMRLWQCRNALIRRYKRFGAGKAFLSTWVKSASPELYSLLRAGYRTLRGKSRVDQ